MQETQVQSLGQENPLEKGIANCLVNATEGEAWQAIVHGVAKSQTQLSDFHFHSKTIGNPHLSKFIWIYDFIVKVLGGFIQNIYFLNWMNALKDSHSYYSKTA